MNRSKRIYLSPPHMGGKELAAVCRVFDENWIAPVGPDINRFEEVLCSYTGARYAVALSSGTAAIHLALQLCGVRAGDDVFCSSFTFAGSAFPIVYLNANPVFIDSEVSSWNMDPELLRKALKERSRQGKCPGAVIVVHLYGQSANVLELAGICDEFSVPLIEDAAESLGAFCGETHTGVMGEFGVFSFNGNKIITTSGGGALIGKDKEKIEKARYLSTQARDPQPYYEHSTVGYNYRLSNICAAIGCGQMEVLEERVEQKRQIYQFYKKSLSQINGVSLIPIDVYGRGNCWLTAIMLDQKSIGVEPETIRLVLEQNNIESRPLWKPMHLQPVFRRYPSYLNGVSESIFSNGLCLPSGTGLNLENLNRIYEIISIAIQKRQ